MCSDRTRRGNDNNNRHGRNRQQQRNVQNQILPRSPDANPQKQEPEKKTSPPPPKKPKRVINEDELSEGEIVDSD